MCWPESSLGQRRLARVLGNGSGRAMHVGTSRATKQVLELVHIFFVCMVHSDITCTNSFGSWIAFSCLGMGSDNGSNT